MFDDLLHERPEPGRRPTPRGRLRLTVALALTVAVGAGGLTARAVLDDRTRPAPALESAGIDLDVQPASLGEVDGELAPSHPLVRALTVRDRGPLALRYSVAWRVRPAGSVDLAPLLRMRLFPMPGEQACLAAAAGPATGDAQATVADTWAPLRDDGRMVAHSRLSALTGSQVWCLRLDLPADAGAAVDGARVDVDLRFDAEQEPEP